MEMNYWGWQVRTYDANTGDKSDTLYFGNADDSSTDAYAAAEKIHRLGFWQGHQIGCVSVFYCDATICKVQADYEL